MRFTQDWFSANLSSFELVKSKITPIQNILEIGCFEGIATCWMLQNMLVDDGLITCVDTFKGSEEHRSMDLLSLELQFRDNVKEAQKSTQTVEILPIASYNALGYLISRESQYDFIYVDGDHSSSGVMTDACMAFGMLKQGGIMLFDDYLWKDVPGAINQPKMAVDQFLLMFEGKCQLMMLGYQLAIEKL